MTESVDPRWRAVTRHQSTCTACGERHEGLFDLACAKPEFWEGPEVYAPNSAIVTSTNCLTSDFCILNDEHYFVRCVLKLPLIGAPGEHFAFGVWSTLSKNNFSLYAAAFDSGVRDDLGPWFGWFSNRLKPYPDTLNLKCRVHPQGERQRPWIELEPTDHPLARESVDGITYERLVEIYEANGHSLPRTMNDH